MSYIKPKRIWKKRFDEKTLNKIWEIFIQNSPKKEWEESDKLKDMISEYGNFPHPETDKEDNTEGIQPEQIEEFLNKFTLEDLDNVLKLLMIYREHFNGFISDGYIAWDRVFSHFVLMQKEPLIGNLVYILNLNFFNQYKVEKEVIDFLDKNPENINAIKEAAKAGLIKNNTITLECIDLEGYLEERKRIWKEIAGVTPQSEKMLLSNPENFNKEFIDVVNRVYGTRQIAKLKEDEQLYVSIMNNLLGMNASVIPTELILKEIESLVRYNTNSFTVEDYRPVLQKLMKTEPTLITLYNFIVSFKANKNIYEAMRKKDEITKEDLEVYAYMNSMLRICTEKDAKKLLKMDLYFWKTFYRYGVSDPTHIVRLQDLYEKNKDNESCLPNIKGEVDKYEYEIIKKDNPIGLILGYATDCCQVMNNNGESCLYAGYEQKDSGFLAILKNGRVFAQSWIWVKEYEPGKRVVCFDSVEVLGKDLNKSKAVLKAYEIVSDELIEAGFDMVICGADGSTMPKGLTSIGKKTNKVSEMNLNCPFNVYTDARDDIIIIRD